jgi:hypothetical protein
MCCRKERGHLPACRGIAEYADKSLRTGKTLEQQEITLTADGLEDMRNDCMDMLQAIIAMLDGAKYLWQGVQIDKEKSPDSGNC